MSSTRAEHYFETRVEFSDDPLHIATRLASSGLHSDHVVYENGGLWSYAGGARAEITVDRTGARLWQQDLPETFLPWNGRPLQQVQELLDSVAVPAWRAYGWAAFELSYVRYGRLEDLGDETLLHLIIPEVEVRWEQGGAHIRGNDPATLAALRNVMFEKTPTPAGEPEPADVRGLGSSEYRDAVKIAVDEINGGRLDKVILSRTVEVETDIDLVTTYAAGRRSNNPARSFLLALGGLEAAGFSPEIVVGVSVDGHVVHQPLAGTRALTCDAAENERLHADLLASPKEVYEHAISVKIATDELAGVCEPGTVGVPDFMTVRPRGSVQHLASRVTGQLAGDARSWDAFEAVFPAVTASGVSKTDACAAIHRHELERRGLYSGAVITVDHTGVMDAALALRTVYREGGRTWLRAGAGVVGQSTPDREFEETCEKLDSVAKYLVPAKKGEQR